MTKVNIELFVNGKPCTIPKLTSHFEDKTSTTKCSESTIDKFSTRNLGRHDHGKLPELQTGTLFDDIKTAMRHSREEFSSYLNELVIEESRMNVNQESSKAYCTKKQKVDYFESEIGE